MVSYHLREMKCKRWPRITAGSQATPYSPHRNPHRVLEINSLADNFEKVTKVSSKKKKKKALKGGGGWGKPSCFWRQQITIIPQVDKQKVALILPCPIIRLPRSLLPVPGMRRRMCRCILRAGALDQPPPKLDEINHFEYSNISVDASY